MPVYSMVLSLLFVLASVAATASPIPQKTSSCFTGNYVSIAAYLASVRDANSGVLDDAQEKNIVASYNRWRAVDQQRVVCKFFTYYVDDIRR